MSLTLHLIDLSDAVEGKRYANTATASQGMNSRVLHWGNFTADLLSTNLSLMLHKSCFWSCFWRIKFSYAPNICVGNIICWKNMQNVKLNINMWHKLNNVHQYFDLFTLWKNLAFKLAELWHFAKKSKCNQSNPAFSHVSHGTKWTLSPNASNTILAASGSEWKLNSEQGVLLPLPETAPPMIYNSPVFWTKERSSCMATARFVSGPNAKISVLPGLPTNDVAVFSSDSVIALVGRVNAHSASAAWVESTSTAI